MHLIFSFFTQQRNIDSFNSFLVHYFLFCKFENYVFCYSHLFMNTNNYPIFFIFYSFFFKFIRRFILSSPHISVFFYIFFYSRNSKRIEKYRGNKSIWAKRKRDKYSTSMWCRKSQYAGNSDVYIDFDYKYIIYIIYIINSLNICNFIFSKYISSLRLFRLLAFFARFFFFFHYIILML